MDYFQRCDSDEYQPSAIISAYRAEYPGKSDTILLDYIKKDLIRLKRQWAAKVDCAEKYLKNWKRFKNELNASETVTATMESEQRPFESTTGGSEQSPVVFNQNAKTIANTMSGNVNIGGDGTNSISTSDDASTSTSTSSSSGYGKPSPKREASDTAPDTARAPKRVATGHSKDNSLDNSGLQSTGENSEAGSPAAIYADFIARTSFQNSHYYRLEAVGIIQCGYNLVNQADIPQYIYDIINYEAPLAKTNWMLWRQYVSMTLGSDNYGTELCTSSIFSTNELPENYDEKTFLLISRIFQALVRNGILLLCIVAFIRLAATNVPELAYDFRVGETPLQALENMRYNADGMVFVRSSGIEVLLLEASGPFGTRDKGRHVFDHVKGAFGCYTMLAKILGSYQDAEPSLADEIRVFFLHSSAKDDYIRLWIMRPVLQGQFISFERHSKVKINKDRHNQRAVLDVVEFFLNLQQLLQRCMNAIEALKKSHESYIYEEKRDRKPLIDLLKPKPLKPIKTEHYKDIVDLDPVSFLF
ncbi:hypothetical protein EC973_002861 [Apophysomyces ossiformis]|uniref:Uncharacterized protein n=1 Tax=Apophysomyces ossiformis TaxID=679940 RepID=A0A8H7ENE8_9FUNG|nr:hypothetical protein EC973_002861 [Apophysomyces ossiformis]